MYKFVTILFITLYILGCSVVENNGVFKTYYEDGVIKSVQSFENGSLNGISRQFYESGMLKHAIHYKNDEIDGMHNSYFPNGALWINEFYDQGNVIGRREFDEEGRIVKEEGHGWEY